jgi:hypothetical protein
MKRITKAHDYERKPLHFRVACVLLLGSLLINGVPDWPTAHAKMKVWIKNNNKNPDNEPVKLGDRGYDYLKRYWDNFNKYGSVEDGPRSGRPHKFSEADALRAASLVKQGMWLTTRVRGKDIKYLSYYTSIMQACQHCGELEQIRLKYKATYAQLLAAMHFYEHTLVYRRVFLKHSFTPAELRQRMAFSADMLRRHAESDDFLTRTIYIDEASLVISEKTKSDIRVWCEKNDLSFTDVCPIKYHKGKEVTVRWICAVTAHPAFKEQGGLVYLEFTTGTTDIHRRQNTRIHGGTPDPSWVYQVGSLHQPEPVVAILIHITTAVGHQLLHGIHIRHQVAIQVVQFSSI